MNKIKKIAVVGAGIMGHGIALVSAMGGYNVLLTDVKESSLLNGISKIRDFLAKIVEKKIISGYKKERLLAKIRTTRDIRDVKDYDLVIEAIIENKRLKRKLFENLDKICSKEAIFASNTSTIPIKKLASVTGRAEKFIGMHFMNPVPLMKLIEIVKTPETSEETVKIIKKIAENMGKIPIVVNDSPGFVSNRLLMPMINEAVYCLMEGVAPKEAIDEIMKIGMNHPMGPLELADLIGLDTCLYIMQELYRGFSNKKYKPCPLLKKMVKKGYLGRKTGKGFYNYEHR